MSNKLGMHWMRLHPDGRDLDHIAKMQYRSVKLFEWHWSNRDACRDLLSVLPRDSYILARDHPLSEQKADMWRDPVGTGRRHADEWADKVRSGRCHVPTDRTFFLGINEPDATNGDRSSIDRYTEAYLTRLQQHGLRGGAFNFSTGHPRTVDGTPNTQADYSVFEASRAAIVRGHHIAVAHIYGTAAEPCVPGHFDRLRACSWQDVEWVIGEFGIDEHVIGGGNHDGYLRSLANPADYCAWLDTAILGIGDRRIHSYQVFTYDFSHPWDSFDVRPIRDALESYPWLHATTIADPPQPKPQTATVNGALPTGSNPTVIESVAAAIVDPLVAQTLITVESGGQAFGPNGRLLIRFENHIFKGKLNNDALYARHFQHGSPVWTGHKWRRSEGEPWQEVHTGSQASEYAAFELAASLHRDAAHQSISMGLGQIMGFNARRVGYASAEAMFRAFGDARYGATNQIVAFLNFFLSDAQLAQAVRAKDWRTIARLYNGPGNVDQVAPLLEETYRQFGGA